MPRRALTILEVLVAVALLVAMTSLTIPTLARWIRPIVFEEAAARVESAARLAASEARRTDEPMALVARPARDSDRVELVLMPLADADEMLEETRGDATDPESQFGSAPDPREDFSRLLPDAGIEPDPMSEEQTPSERMDLLPPGCRFVPSEMVEAFEATPETGPTEVDLLSRPASTQIPADGETPARDRQAFLSADVEQRSPWLIAIGLPDGTLAAGDDVVFIGGDRMARVRLGPVGSRVLVRFDERRPLQDDAEERGGEEPFVEAGDDRAQPTPGDEPSPQEPMVPAREDSAP